MMADPPKNCFEYYTANTCPVGGGGALVQGYTAALNPTPATCYANCENANYPQVFLGAHSNGKPMPIIAPYLTDVGGPGLPHNDGC